MSHRVKYSVETGWPEDCPSEQLKLFFRVQNELGIHDGCILRGSRVVIPLACQDAVLDELHEIHPAIPGNCRMTAFARNYVWWPNLGSYIEKKVGHCDSCQIHSYIPEKVPPHSWEYPAKLWTQVHLDYAGPFCGKMFLIVVDAYSKWMEVYHPHPKLQLTD